MRPLRTPLLLLTRGTSIAGLVSLALLLGLCQLAPAASAAPSRLPAARFPSSIASGTRLIVRVAMPSRMRPSTLSLQQWTHHWMTLTHSHSRHGRLATLSLQAPSSAQTMLLRVRISRAGHRLWASRHVPVEVQPTAAQPCPIGQTGTPPNCQQSLPTPGLGEALSEGPPSSTVPVIDAPSWWSGECDSANHPGSFPLGATWHGLVACGPQPAAEHAPDRTVRYFSGAWGEYEFECVELSMRWMYLAYGVHPYEANGFDIVENYTPADGGSLVKVLNGTPGRPPQPGDVLEVPREDHTAVVSAVSVNAEGNGSVTVIQQNAGSSGWGTYAVNGWTVARVYGWLHRP